MDVQTIVGIAIASLVVIVLAHVAIVWFLRTMYPSAPVSPSVPIPETKTIHVSPQSFTDPEQHVSIPTYETPLPNETPREEGATPIGELSRDPVQRDAGVAPPNA